MANRNSQQILDEIYETCFIPRKVSEILRLCGTSYHYVCKAIEEGIIKKVGKKPGNYPGGGTAHIYQSVTGFKRENRINCFGCLAERLGECDGSFLNTERCGARSIIDTKVGEKR